MDWTRLGAYIVSSGDTLRRIILGLAKCPYDDPGVSVRDSPGGNGFHVEVKCSREGCDLCRLVFDSPIRFERDLDRPPRSRDVLWDRKAYRKGGGRMIGVADEWRRVN